MSDLNIAILIGNVAADPEIRYLPDGKPVASLRLITNRRYKDRQSGESKEVATGHNVKYFGPLAEVVKNYVKKGKQIRVNGRIETRSYTPDGATEKRYITEIVGDELQLLGSPAGEKAPADLPPPEGDDNDGSDIPF